MGAHDHVSASIDISSCRVLLHLFQLVAVLNAPVDAANHQVRLLLCLGDDFFELGRVIAAQNPRRIFSGVWGIEGQLRSGCVDVGHFQAVQVINQGFCRLRFVAASTHIVDARLAQVVQGVVEGVLAIVVDVVVGQSHQVGSHLFQIGDILGLCPKGIRLPRQLFPSVGEGKLVVDAAQVCLIHLLQQHRIDAGGQLAAGGVFQVLHHIPVIVQVDVSGEC